MSAHLLSLASLHAADPGVLDVIFGRDGDFDGAPRWLGPVWDPLFEGWDDVAPAMWIDGPPEDVLRCALDLRVPSVAARLLRLASFVESVDPNLEPHEIAALTLALAPRIAALGGFRG